MARAYTAEQIRTAEEPLLAAGAPLMRRAAHGLAQQVLTILRDRGTGRVSGARVVALVGKGNNGGDALWALAVLRRRGVHVSAIPVGVSAVDLHSEGSAALLRAGGTIENRIREDTAVVIDGLLGTGFRGEIDVPGLLTEAGLVIPERTVIVACDVPSGLNATTGEIPGAVLPANITVTFGALKTGLLLGDGPGVCGQIEAVDIGLEQELEKRLTFRKVSVLPDHDVSGLARIFAAPAWNAHKYSRGVIAVSAGSARYPGAAVLTVAAAVATGVGMVRFVGEPSVCASVVAAHPEVVAGTDTSGRADAWVLGPGWGTGDQERRRYQDVLKSAEAHGTAVVLDASALELIDTDDAAAFSRIREAGGAVVLTPHAGELSRLEGRLHPGQDEAGVEAHALARGEAAELTRARWLAERLGAYVVLKGPTTVIAAPEGSAILDAAGTASLATAGSGDTLAGLIGSALGRAVSDSTPDTLDRIAAAVRLHAFAGRRAQQDGPFGASALAPAVRAVLAESGRIAGL